MIERVVTEQDIVNLKAKLGATMDAWVEGLEVLDVDPDPEPDPREGEPRNPMVSAGDGRIVITWDAPTVGVPTGYRYGRDGTDAGGAGPWRGMLGPDARTATLDKLVNGRPYEVMLAAVYPAGDVVLTSTATPVGAPPPPVPPPAPGGRSVPLVGHSRMPFNVTIFNGGDTTQAALTAQAKTMGFAQFDGGLNFATRDRGWGAVRDDKLAADIKGVLDAGGIFILSLPHSLDGDSLMNQKGAANEYLDEQVALGQWLVSKGLNREGLWLRNWESNGGWYPWTAAAPGGVPALRSALKNWMDNLRAGGLTRVKFDLCLNMPSSASNHTWADLWPGPGYWSALTIDGYDAYQPVRSHADWEAKQSVPHSLRGALAAAAKLSTAAWPVMGGQDEGGNWHGPNGAGDNPTYYVELFGELMKAPEQVCWLNIYNDRGLPANLLHGFADNPRAFARVRQIVAGLLAK